MSLFHGAGAFLFILKERFSDVVKILSVLNLAVFSVESYNGFSFLDSGLDLDFLSRQAPALTESLKIRTRKSIFGLSVRRKVDHLD